MKRVVVGLSGGVDSSVAAYLLLEKGYDVIGMFMRNWHDETVTLNNECPWIDDSNDAMLVAQKLGIPFQTIDLSKEYYEKIVEYMFAEYQRGRTPNPDVLCNREIKFDVFLNTALKLGADYVATGHYCQKDTIEKNGQSIYRLIAGADKSKDQSYFLCQVNQFQLSKALFPIGHLQKSEVRAIAEKAGLLTANKKDSQGLCFVGKISLPDFLQQKLKPQKGEVIEVSPEDEIFKVGERDDIIDLSKPYNYEAAHGKFAGTHEGAHFYTIGQRKGLNIGGKTEPLFVLHIDTVKNIIYAGQGQEHPGLYRNALKIQASDVHWIRPDLEIKEGETLAVTARIRYRQPVEKALITKVKGDIYMRFEKPQRGITPGQFAAWYLEEEQIGSGVIFE